MPRKKQSNNVKINDILTEQQEKRMSHLNDSIESSNETSSSFLAPALTIMLICVVLICGYWAVSNITSKPLKTKIQEIEYYLENHQPHWQNIRLLGYTDVGYQVDTGYYYNGYFSTVDVDSLIDEGVNLGQWADENKGKLFGRVVIGLDNNDFLLSVNDNINYYESYLTKTISVNGEDISCVQFYGLIYSLTDESMYNAYSKYGTVYIPSRFLSNPDDFVDTGIPVYSLDDIYAPPTEDTSTFSPLVNLISEIFSGFKLITNIVLTGFSFISFVIGFIWVLFT